MSLIAQHGGSSGQYVLGNQILPDNGNDHAGRAHILLNAAVDHGVLAHIHRLRQEAGRYVGHQILALGIGQFLKFGSVDGVVFADVYVVRILADGKIRAVGNVREGLVGRGCHRIGLAKEFCLLIGLFRPLTGDDIIRHLIFHEVHGNHGKLLAGAALEEQHLVAFRNAHQLPQVAFRPVDNILIGRRPVTHLHNGHAASPVIQHFCCCLAQNRLRQHCRASRKIINS